MAFYGSSNWIGRNIIQPTTATAFRGAGAVADVVGADRSAQGYFRQASNITNPNASMNQGVTMTNGLPGVPGMQRGGNAVPGAVDDSASTTSQNPGGTTGAQVSNGGSNGYSSVNPNDIAVLNSGIGRATNSLGLLDRQQQVGDENINSSYSSALNRLMSGQTQAKQQFDTTRSRSTQDNINTRNDINASVGRQANGLQRLLGAKGAGNSSAARVAAPYAAALQGTQQLRQVGDAYQQNMQDLDTNWNNYSTGVEQSKQELDQGAFQNRQSLKAGVAEKRASILQQLAELNSQRSLAQGGNSAAALAAANPYMNQIDSLQGDIVNLGAQYAAPINVQQPTYANPNLQQYNYEQPLGAGMTNDSAYTDNISPALYSLLNQRRQNNALGY